jgi:hypothetical protein
MFIYTFQATNGNLPTLHDQLEPWICDDVRVQQARGHATMHLSLPH